MALPVQVRAVLEYRSIAKYQIPSTKLQTNLKFQYSMTKTKNRFGISNFGHCDLFDICDLLFGISGTPVFQQTAARWKEYGSPLRGQCKAGSFGSGFFTIAIKLLAPDVDERLVVGKVWTHPPHQNAL